jgi:hypothetical protein
MTIATGRGTRLALVAESVFGTTPTTPTFQNLRPTRSTLRPTIEKGESSEFTTDRNIRGTFMTGKGAEGRIEGELHYGTWDNLIQAALGGTWASNVLKIGNVIRAFTIEETYELGSLDHYHRYLGCEVDAMEFTFNANDTVRVAFDIMSREMVAAGAAIVGATYTAASTTRMPATTESIAGVTWSGVTASAIYLQSFNFKVENNLRRRPVWDDARSINFGQGMSRVTGTALVYFNDRQIYQEIAAQSAAGLEFTVGVASGSKYTFDFPALNWGDGRLTTRERDTDIMVEMPFTAIYDSTDATSLTITRAVS